MNYHQGDVFLVRVKEIPPGAKLVRKDVVAYGEVTGHSHRLVDSLFYEKDGESYLKVTSLQPMTHEEHPATEQVEVGNYKVQIQHEYFPEGLLKVKD